MQDPNKKSQPSQDSGLDDWAKQCFGQPESESPLLDLRLPISVKDMTKLEPALYLDRHTRDAELGRQLFMPYRSNWEQLVNQIRGVATQEQRQLASVRARLEAMKRVNSIERNPALQYPQKAIDEATYELEKLPQTARLLQVPALSLEKLLRLSSNDAMSFDYDCEQALRMLSQAMKGQLKVFAHSKRFANRNKLQNDIALWPGLPPVTVGISVPLTLWPVEGQECVVAVLRTETTSYLFHLLKAAFSLCAQASAQWAAMRDSYKAKLHWPVLFSALRAVLDIYHFCAFEMPFGLRDVVVDRSNPAKILRFANASNGWQEVEEKAWVDKPLKRWITESIGLMQVCSYLMGDNHRSEEENLPKQITKEVMLRHPLLLMEGNFQLYFSVGIANLPAHGAISGEGIASVSQITNHVLAEIIRAEPQEFPIEAEDIGNWLTQVMMLDEEVFHLPDGQTAISESERVFLLGQFWQEMGHWRAADLVGHHYAQTITAYREQYLTTNEQAHQTDLQSIESVGEEPIGADLLQSLQPEEQQQILTAVNFAWRITCPILEKLAVLNKDDQLEEIVQEFLQALETYGESLAMCFPENWIISTHESWSLMRLQSPIACDLFNQIHEPDGLQHLIANARWQFMLASLLRLSGDVTRLKLLIETCSFRGRAHIEQNAEPCARLLLQACLACYRYVQDNNLTGVPAIEDIVFVYFDEDYIHNAWSSFIDRSLSELENFLALTNSDDSQEICTLIATTMANLRRIRPHQREN